MLWPKISSTLIHSRPKPFLSRPSAFFASHSGLKPFTSPPLYCSSPSPTNNEHSFVEFSRKHVNSIPLHNLFQADIGCRHYSERLPNKTKTCLDDQSIVLISFSSRKERQHWPHRLYSISRQVFTAACLLSRKININSRGGYREYWIKI